MRRYYLSIDRPDFFFVSRIAILGCSLIIAYQVIDIVDRFLRGAATWRVPSDALVILVQAWLIVSIVRIIKRVNKEAL